MKSTHTPIVLALAALAGLAATPAAAQDPSGWYIGGNVGRSGATIDEERITSGLAGQGLATSGISNRDHDTAYKLFGGYQINRNFAVEAGYFDLGSFGYTASTVPLGTLSGDVRMKGVNLDLVGTLPITERFSVLGRIGVTSARSSGHFSATGAAAIPYASANTRERATNPKVGIGLAYAFTESLSMRAEAERYRMNDSVGNRGHVDMVSVGLVYRFGAKPQPIRTAAPAPYVAPPPAPAPVYVAPPPPAPVMAAPPAPAPAPFIEPTRPAKPYRN
jgi:OmpA-OmpF porin, OOP family